MGVLAFGGGAKKAIFGQREKTKRKKRKTKPRNERP